MGWQSLHKVCGPFFNAYAASFDDPEAQQIQFLKRIIHNNAHSRFGCDHGFSDIKTLGDFQTKVPILSYADLKPYIDQIIAGDRTALTRDEAIMFELTGGSSGGQKYIPYCASTLIDFQNSILPWVSDFLTHHPQIMAGKAYFAISPDMRTQKTVAGLPIGLPSDAAYFGSEAAPHISDVLVHHPALSTAENWSVATSAWLAATSDLTLISVWSPTFLTNLLKILAQNPDQIAKAIHDGEYGITPDPDQAKRVEQGPNALWPHLRMISAWADASSAPFMDDLRKHLPNIYIQPKGLLATEGVFTFPLCDAADPLPALHSAFLEFEDESGTVHTVGSLIPDASYDLIVTTNGGFYRYRIGDRVQCTGYYNAARLPMLKFIGRSGQTTDMVGEKLTEDFVLSCTNDLGFPCVLIPVNGTPSRYDIAIDAQVIPPNDLAERIDKKLKANPQYAYARDLGQLGAPRIVQHPNLLDRYIAFRLSQGHRLSDIKAPVLLKPEFANLNIWM